MNRVPISALPLAFLVLAGCGAEPRGPFQAGGRDVKSWVDDLKSPKSALRRQAVHKLGNVGDVDPAAAEALNRALNDSNALVRHDAVIAVLKLSAPNDAIVARLQVMAKSDSSPPARDAAKKALTKLGRAD